MWEADLVLAHQLAEEARMLSLSYFGRTIGRWAKSDGSLATDADISVERALRQRLAVERPEDAVLGEEEGESGAGPRRWIIDAIDGTVDFAQGGRDWSTLIALEARDRIVVGVCDQPAHDRRYWASHARGAYSVDVSGTPRPLVVSSTTELASARSYVPPATWLADDRARRIAQAVADATSPCDHVNHPALEVAVGDYEVALFLSGGPWDLAVFALIVEEAGGRFTDLRGRADVFSGTALYSNGKVHDAVLKIIAEHQH
jgi:histidinol-phosphatase